MFFFFSWTWVKHIVSIKVPAWIDKEATNCYCFCTHRNLDTCPFFYVLNFFLSIDIKINNWTIVLLPQLNLIKCQLSPIGYFSCQIEWSNIINKNVFRLKERHILSLQFGIHTPIRCFEYIKVLTCLYCLSLFPIFFFFQVWPLYFVFYNDVVGFYFLFFRL